MNTGFDFTALIQFLQALFDAFVALFGKLGFTFGEDEADEGENAEL